ncbi:hypothetical protein IZ6_07390 [Terrihabitans soli]|uniref:Uncharacterized protein n=1 Tax=Terrihabitans soli TaxID=708113 RepID=A0A6S6QIF3_9HYPH|nr:hypothetical protein [Terrihabitans soli]BCJ90004.1 hypothetical protein IZ6_07390 [Terrihabitans soli]
MTTKDSPLRELRRQAEKIAATLKAFERGEQIEPRFAEKLHVARTQETFTVGIVMDDKLIKLELYWTLIRSSTETGLAEYVLKLMRETRDDA